MDSSDYSYSDDLGDKVKTLSDLANQTGSNMQKKEKCIPTLLIVGILTPIVIWVVLYFIKPSFVQKKNPDGSYERENKKVFMWSFIITLVIWACLYLWTYCQGYDKNAFTCFKK